MTTKVLTPEEIQSLKLIQDKRIQLVEQFGVLEMRLQDLEYQKEQLNTELRQLRQKEILVGENLQQKYGDGSIDLEKGEFMGG